MKMTLRLPALAAAMALAAVLAGVVPGMAQNIVAPERTTAAQDVSDARRSSRGHVYLLRGLLNVFSLGMDELAAKLQARGISASVHNHAEWEALANEIAAKYKAGDRGAIILVGHSLGADAVMFMGEYLGKKRVPIALIVPFDGTGSFAASSNVARVMNLTQRDYAYMTRGNGFRGELRNIDVSGQGVGHIDIDKSDRLHKMVINKILSVIGRGSRRPKPATDTSAASAAKPTPKPKPAALSAKETEAKPANESAAKTDAKPSGDSKPSETTVAKPANDKPAGDSAAKPAASTGTSGAAAKEKDVGSATPATPEEKPRLRL